MLYLVDMETGEIIAILTDFSMITYLHENWENLRGGNYSIWNQDSDTYTNISDWIMDY